MENVTLDGLQCWLKYEYEHLGWSALCLAKGHFETAYAYYMSLNRLKNAIEQRRNIHTECKHTIRDLEI